MKKITRYGSGIAIVAAATLALSGCGFSSDSGSNSGDSAGKTELNLLVPTYSDNTKGLWEDVIAGFEKANSDITVKLEVQSWDNINDVVRTKVQGNQAPDILNVDAFAGFAADDLLYPAKDVLSAETLGDFQDSFAQNASIDGEQYGLPLIASARTLFVNNDLLKQAGVAAAPKTWAELKDAAVKISALGGGVYGYGLPLGSEEAQAETGIWFWGGGGGYGDASTIDINNAKNVEAMQFVQDLVNAKGTQPDAGSTDRTPLINVFIQGKIGMIAALPPTVGQIAEKNPALDYSMVPLPTKDGSAFTLGVADHLMAFKNDGKKQDAITKFFDYYYSADVYVPWVKAEGFLPTTKSGAEQLSSDEALKPFLDVLPSAKFYPSTNPKWSSAQGAVQSLIGKIAQGSKPADVLSEIQSKADAG